MSVILLFFLVWMITFFLIRTLVPVVGIDVIALALGFGITALSTQRIERYLKQRWPSGRSIQINQHAIQLVKKGSVQTEVDPRQRVNVLLWHFKIGRRSRVKRGWLVVACALEQDENYLAVYTFMPPADFESQNLSPQFSLLQKIKEQKDPGGRLSNQMQVAGIQRRLHVAEKVRWLDGAEITPDDFSAYLKALQDRFPQWMPSVV
jgi:hypothetical protein